MAHYLATAKHLPPQQQWNRTGRAYPDVAAFSTGFMVVTDLFPQPVDGTSCATPTFSGVLSLVNGVRLENGKAPLGFLNPLLYSSGGAANTDILVGFNPNCNSDGFTCQAGWDPVTGYAFVSLCCCGFVIGADWHDSHSKTHDVITAGARRISPSLSSWCNRCRKNKHLRV